MGSNYNTIWIVDDDDVTRFIIKKNLENAGVSKDITGYGLAQDVLNDLMVTKKLPDLILLDINMPEMDAWQFLEECEKLPNKLDGKVDIFIVTSSINSIDKQRASKISLITGFIIKPFSVDQLLAN